MNGLEKHELQLEGLSCASCSVKIEEHLGRIEGIGSASVNFTTGRLTFESEGDQAVLHQKVRKTISEVEPQVIISPAGRAAAEGELVLEGLSCASCAAKIEAEVGSLDGVSGARLDMVTGKLAFTALSEALIGEISERAGEIARRIEPEITVHRGRKPKKTSRPQISRVKIAIFSVGAALFAAGLILRLQPAGEFALFFTSFLLVGGRVLLKAGRNILRGDLFDENFLMSIATIGAFAIGEFPEGAAVMIFYQVGEFFQDMAVHRSKRSIAELMDIRPDTAHLKRGDEVVTVSPEEVHPEEVILIRPGERIPLDGVVISGSGLVDASALTGESLPRETSPGDEVLSGTVNVNGLLTVEVTKGFGESTAAKIIDLVEHAAGRKAKTENFITKFARYYTPAVVFAAAALALLPPLLIEGATFSQWINRALVFLVVSCPCALVISIPLGFFGGIGAASRRGILIKGSNYLEALNSVGTVVFDKTGTLTRGVFTVTGIYPREGFSSDELLQLAALAEGHSTHPIARSICAAAGSKRSAEDVSDYLEHSGHGVSVTAGGRRILAGNRRLMEEHGVEITPLAEPGSAVYVSADGRWAGSLLISDEIKPESRSAVRELRELGVSDIIMLTGDTKEVADKVAGELGINTVYAELLPDGKVARVEELAERQPAGRKLVFVGDGINDAPVLARADVGVAMGGVGSDAAIEAADVVLMTDGPQKLAEAVGIARRTRAIVWQNIIFALGVKGLVLLLGAFGLATMWAAVFADVGVALLAVLNALRIIRS